MGSVKNVKNFGSLDEVRKIRGDDAMIERTNGTRTIRKDELLTKRRTNPFLSSLPKKIKDRPEFTVNDDTLIQWISNNMYSNDPESQFNGTQQARKILSRTDTPPIDEVIRTGVVPRCVQFLKDPNRPDLVYEAAWVLTNIGSESEDQTEVVVGAGAVEPLIQLLNSQHSNVVEQSVWALGNIAGGGPTMRDFVIKEGIVDPLVALAKTELSPTALHNIAWTILNLCRNKSPPPPDEVVNKCLPALIKLLSYDEPDVITDACWALRYISDIPQRIETLFEAGLIPRLVELLSSPFSDVLTPCLRTVGNIVAGSFEQTQAVIDAGVVPALFQLLQDAQANVMKDAAWTVSNICCGTKEQISAVIEGGLVPHLLDILHAGDFETRKEAAYAVSNIAITEEHTLLLFHHGVLPSIFAVLPGYDRDEKFILAVMEGLQSILQATKREGLWKEVTEEVEVCGGIHKLKEARIHSDIPVRRMALLLLQEYFDDDEDYTDEDDEEDLGIFFFNDFQQLLENEVVEKG